MGVFDKFKDFMGLNEEYEYDESDDEAYSGGEHAPAEPIAAPKPAHHKLLQVLITSVVLAKIT
jgi:hypothetical protein